MLWICDQVSIVQQPLEKNEKCIEIKVLLITFLGFVAFWFVTEPSVSAPLSSLLGPALHVGLSFYNCRYVYSDCRKQHNNYYILNNFQTFLFSLSTPCFKN